MQMHIPLRNKVRIPRSRNWGLQVLHASFSYTVTHQLSYHNRVTFRFAMLLYGMADITQAFAFNGMLNS